MGFCKIDMVGGIDDMLNAESVNPVQNKVLNKKFSNNFSANSTNIPVNTDFTCHTDGIVSYGGYSTSLSDLIVNGISVSSTYGGNQVSGGVYNSWRVNKGDVVHINVTLNAGATNIHSFTPLED